ncbi:MAG: hypothetical protein KGJ72_14180 [Gammaproteobacteria bacterium]|nr:hypothetical protein [Gammaproteobacteria bacterium]
MAKPADLARYRANLRSELDGAALYRAIAEAEPDPARRSVLMELARAESRHAALWREKLRAAGAPEPSFSPSMRTRAARGARPPVRAALRDVQRKEPGILSRSAGCVRVCAAAVTYGIGRLLGAALS